MKKMIIIASIVLFITIVMYVYLGGFSNLRIRTENVGGETVIYKEITGDYNNLSPITNEIYYYLLNKLSIETYKGFGIFYDNPRLTEKSKLRAEAGCIIETQDVKRLKDIDSRYKIKTLPITKTIIAEFPYRNSISIFFGYIKGFPAIEKYRKKHGLADGILMAILDVPGKKIIYRKVVTD